MNHSYFEGRLRSWRVERLSARVYLDTLERERLGRTVPYGRTIGRHRLIWLRPGMGAWLERRVLLHEMCHATTLDESGQVPHGPRWRAEMLRIAFDHGEVWAVRQVLRYAREADACAEAAYIARQEQFERERAAWAVEIRQRGART